MPPPCTLRGFISLAHTYKNRSNHNQELLMDLLVTLHEQPVLWTEQYVRWNDLITTEDLCTPNRFNMYRRALSLRLNVCRLGVEAACTLASYPAPVRIATLRRVNGWITSHNAQPTYQRVAEYVRQVRSEMGQSEPTSLARWQAYARELQTIVTSLGGNYPEEP